jgi:putative NADPH-quinone reductase
MASRILIVQGHPDTRRAHLCHALAQSYADGATAAGHGVEVVEPARLTFPLLSSPAEWRHGCPPPQLVAAQESIRRADHLVFVYPLWLGDMPAVLKGFLEQVARPGFGVDDAGWTPAGTGSPKHGLLRGRSARVVVSTAMAAPLYRWIYGAHSIKLMRRHILGPAGITPMRSTVVGSAAAMRPELVERWRERLHRLGQRAG